MGSTPSESAIIFISRYGRASLRCAAAIFFDSPGICAGGATMIAGCSINRAM